MKMKVYLMASLLALSSITVTSCKSEGCTDSMATNFDADAKKDDGTCEYATVETATLYERLGGIDAITLVVDKFLENVVGNEELSCSTCDFAPTIADANRVRLLRLNLIDQVCAASEGPCVYKGKTMKEAHPAGSVTDAEFNSLVGDLVAALDFYSVPTEEKDELIGILGGLKGDIVY